MAEFKRLQGNAVGGDVQELRAFAQHLMQRSIPDIQQIFTQIDQKITQTTWTGNDATGFSSDWESQKTSIMNQLKSALENISQKATKQAADQETVSGA